MEYYIKPIDVPSTPNLIASLQTFSRKASVGAITIGSIVILGWMFNIPLFKSILPGLVTMKANTALCFIFAGGALWMWHQYNETGEWEKGRRERRQGGTETTLANLQ